jgi:hypothetical protein
MKKRFPKFIPYWESYVDYWGEDQGITVQMLPFSEYALDIIKANRDVDIKNIFDFVEFLLCNGDDFVQNAITTSFLEYLLSKDQNEINFSKFSKYLGNQTINYCKAWNKYTGNNTQDLHDKN